MSWSTLIPLIFLAIGIIIVFVACLGGIAIVRKKQHRSQLESTQCQLLNILLLGGEISYQGSFYLSHRTNNASHVASPVMSLSIHISIEEDQGQEIKRKDQQQTKVSLVCEYTGVRGV